MAREVRTEDNAGTVWVWARMSYGEFERLPTSAKRLWGERWAARLEAQARARNRPVFSSRFAPEHLDDVLKRLGMDVYGGLIETEDAIFGRPSRVEDHTAPDMRDWRDIADEAGRKLRANIDVITNRNRERLAAEDVNRGNLF